MSRSSKVHFYPHTLRSASLVGYYMCRGKMIMYLVPPKKAQTIENLYMHFKATFDAGVALADRKVEYVAIGNSKPVFYEDKPTYFNKLPLGAAGVADPTTRKVDIKINLSAILKKANAGYRELFDDSEPGNLTYVYILLPDSLQNTTTVGTIELWKLDGLYTTQGIR